MPWTTLALVETTVLNHFSQIRQPTLLRDADYLLEIFEGSFPPA